MLKNITRRTWSVLIALVMVWTTFCIGQPLTASAAVTASTPGSLTGVKFVVPEAIYLKPAYNSYYQATTSTFQWYVNNGLDSTPKTGEEGQGDIFFNYSGATDAKIGFEWLNASGQAASGGSITVGGTSLSVGYTKDISSSNSAIKVTGGTSPNLAATATGAYVRWTVTYTDSADARTKTVQAYTYVYKPYIEPVGSAIKTLNDRGDNHYGGNLSWICGMHDADSSALGDYFPKCGTDHGLMALSSSDPSGSEAGQLYAQMADRFKFTGISNEGPQNWLETSASPQYMPDKTFRFASNEKDGYSSGDVAFNTFVYSGTGFMTIDISRYTNLNQIPNLSIGLMVTDDEDSGSGAAYFVANYTGTPATSDDLDYNKSWDHAQAIWNKYNEDTIWYAGTPNNLSESESEGIKYNGKWPKAISGTGTSTYYVGTGYMNHQGSDTIWNNAELRMKVTRYNKATLRAAVVKAINNSATMQALFYDTTSTAWEKYVNLFKAASMALTKLDGTFSIAANGTTYTDPNTLANALDGAVDTLLGGSGRLTNRKATQTNIALQKTGESSYIYVPFLNGTTTRTATFKSYDTVTFTADSVPGYTFMGLKRANSAPSIPSQGTSADDPTATFTTSDEGATINGGTVKYTHADTTGTDTSGNIFYTYYYVANTYSVHFEANGGTGTMTDQTFTYNAAQNLSANQFTRQGYAFNGWAKSASGSKVYSDSENVNNLTTAANGTVNLYALWTAVDYSILFDAAGGSISGDYVSSYKITDTFTLPNATRSGYSLSGWRADNSGNWSTMTYTVGNPVSGKYGDVKLTAVWKSNNYSVAFNPNGGSGATMSNQSFVYGTEQALTANAYSREGFTFRGWALTSTASDPLYLDKERVSNLTTEANAVVTLYAVWGTNNYTIVYSTDSGTIRDASYTKTFTVNDQIGLPTTVEKTGYSFTGWKPANNVGTWNATTVYTGTLSAGMIGNVTLQAQWETVAYLITYEFDSANGGAIVGTRYTTNYDIVTAISLPSASKIGYVFNGWLADGAGNWGVSTYNAGSISAGRYGNVTMTAQWTGKQYYVQFNGNGSTSGVMYNQSFTYGVSAPLNPNEYARSGYEFKGWATSSTSTTASYPDQGMVSNLSTTAGATVNLYAVWEKISYTITYDANGGTITTTGATSYTITDAVRLAVAQFTGYTALGWRPAEDSGSWHSWDTYTGTLSAGCYGNVTLVAQWSKDTYTITYDAQGGTLGGSYTTTYDVDTQIVLPEISRTGYNFGGWLADAAWNNVLITNNTAPAGAKGNVKLTAQWAQKTYYVRFVSNGGFGTMNDQLMRFDVSQNLTRNAFTRDGYTFGGWAMSETGTAVYFDGDPVINLTQSDGAVVKLYAQWSARKFTVSYDFNGAEGFMYPTSNIEMDGAAKTLRAYNGEEEMLINDKRYAFKGWAFTQAAAANGMVAYADQASFQMNEEVLAQAEINWTTQQPTVTLYAVWSELEIKLVIPEGATTVIDPDRRFVYGLKAGITQEELKTEYLNVIGNGSLVVDGNGAIGTGTKVRLVNNDTGDTIQEFEIVIFGDINGDGLINSTDYTRMRRITAGLEQVSFNTADGFACDLSNDGDINSTDLTFMRAVSSQLYRYDQANRRYAS